MNRISDVLKLGNRVTVLPVVHGSGDFAVEVRRLMLSHSFDCVAVPLPPSFRIEVETAAQWLPNVSVVLQRDPQAEFSGTGEYSPDNGGDPNEDDFGEAD
ncbi:MAG: hypothetical protein GY826_43940, partial [Fuerstiella sp.]|nr:hypothetical protein [Fuerstiella sp.]